MSDDRIALVTGGAGFIGSHLVRRLAADGFRVRVLDDFSTGKRANLRDVEGDFEVVEGSVTDAETCRAVCEGASFVFHQAAVPSVQRSVVDPHRTHEVGITGTLNVLVAARASGVRRFIYAGSSSAYGDTPTLPKREDMAERPLSPYAVAKLAGEQYTRVFRRVYGLDTVVLRYFNVFGPYQDPGSVYSAVIPRFITAALDGVAPVVSGDGGQTRDFTYVANVVEANILAATAPAERVAGRVFNVASGEHVSILALWQHIARMLDVEIAARHGPARPGDVRDSLADLTEARQALGYRVSVPLAEGLRRTAAFLSQARTAEFAGVMAAS